MTNKQTVHILFIALASVVLAIVIASAMHTAHGDLGMALCGSDTECAEMFPGTNGDPEPVEVN